MILKTNTSSIINSSISNFSLAECDQSMILEAFELQNKAQSQCKSHIPCKYSKYSSSFSRYYAGHSGLGFLNITIDANIKEINSIVTYHMSNYVGEIGEKSEIIY